IRKKAINILSDINRTFVVTDYLLLEILPKPFFNKRSEELNFYKDCLDKSLHFETSPLAYSICPGIGKNI
ncbi:MAG: hypothetical protein LBG48_02395, partial [Rickettsiales bacterium]|nr:hypothetical protein [Rickettsiales bacterium]